MPNAGRNSHALAISTRPHCYYPLTLARLPANQPPPAPRPCRRRRHLPFRFVVALRAVYSPHLPHHLLFIASMPCPAAPVPSHLFVSWSTRPVIAQRRLAPGIGGGSTGQWLGLLDAMCFRGSCAGCHSCPAMWWCTWAAAPTAQCWARRGVGTTWRRSAAAGLKPERVRGPPVPQRILPCCIGLGSGCAACSQRGRGGEARQLLAPASP